MRQERWDVTWVFEKESVSAKLQEPGRGQGHLQRVKRHGRPFPCDWTVKGVSRRTGEMESEKILLGPDCGEFSKAELKR